MAPHDDFIIKINAYFTKITYIYHVFNRYAFQPMKKLLYSFLIISSALVSAQKTAGTKLVVANGVIGTVEMFTVNHKNAVQNSRTYTPASLPDNLKKFSAIAGNGLMEYQLKNSSGTLDRLALYQLNEQFKLSKDTPVLINGTEVADTSLLIYGDLLSSMKLVDYKGKKSVFVDTAMKK